jgi:hypothetical protein
MNMYRAWPGTYAEYALVPQAQLIRIPKGVSMLEAAGVPLAACTAWLSPYPSVLSFVVCLPHPAERVPRPAERSQTDAHVIHSRVLATMLGPSLDQLEAA